MSKIFDEMREIAKEENAKNITNKTLLRIAITGLVDVNDRIELLLEKNRDRDGEIDKINESLDRLQVKANENASEIQQVKEAIENTNNSIAETQTSVQGIKNNTVWLVGDYVKKHPRIGIFILAMVALTLVHVFGSLSGIIKSVEELMKLIGLIA